MQDLLEAPDYTTKAPSDVLGFHTTVAPISDVVHLLSSEDAEKALTEAIRQKALVNVDILSEEFMRRAVDPTASAKLVGDALEANYKLSGLAAKHAPKDLPTQVSITINGIRTLEDTPVLTVHQPPPPAIIEQPPEITDAVTEET